MKILRIVLLLVLVIVAVVLIGGAYLYNDWTRGVLAQTAGELRVAGLRDRVEIVRTDFGIPHIYANNAYDLLFAQGYTQAQDRWWQMEFWRHIAAGRVQELTGRTDSVMGTDLFTRKSGWYEAAERDWNSYNEEARSYIQAFVDGVNAYISGRAPGDLAFEYNVLGLTGVSFTVEPWSPVDTLAFAKIMAWDLGGNRSNELTRMTLYELLGQELTDLFVPAFGFDMMPTIIWPDEIPTPAPTSSQSSPRTITASRLGEAQALADILPRNFVFGEADVVGSNNWVVSGAMSASGMPLLANDPHLGIQMPSIWYEVGLHCNTLSQECPFNVVGFTFAAAAGVVIGHNDNIAWGVTNMGSDSQDVYRIRVNPDNPLQYEWNGAWRDMTVRDEIIRFGDGGELSFQVRETHLGPILNDNTYDPETEQLSGFNNENPMAIRWSAIDPNAPSQLLQAIVGINRASNWEEFRAALQHWDEAGQNVIYADIQGNIGYQSTGRIPMREPEHDGCTPVDGWTDAFEWRGYLPFEYLPTLFNPERGYITTANQAIVPEAYYAYLQQELGPGTYTITQDWDYGYRGMRINQLIEVLAPHSAETFAQIQGDNMLLSAEQIMPYLAALSFSDAALTEARDWLLTWDYQMHMDSAQAALYGEFWRALVNAVFPDQTDGSTLSSGGSLAMWTIYLLLEQPDNAWWDDLSTTDAVETRDAILARAFEQGYAALLAAQGASRDNWRWGVLHTSTFVSNPLGLSGIDLIENYVNRGPFDTSGCSACVNAASWDVSADLTVVALPSMRMIVDLSDLSASQTIHTTGQSGHPASENYNNMIDLWRSIQYHPMLWTREQVSGDANSTLVLVPAQ
ncbi:MAG: penicillin acylase family protein [Chloroflexi bacterium]|nr:penicillin acylase family protein [Chloroflexota bacterium]